MAKKHKITNPRHHRNQLEKEHATGLHSNEMLGSSDQCSGCTGSTQGN